MSCLAACKDNAFVAFNNIAFLCFVFFNLAFTMLSCIVPCPCTPHTHPLRSISEVGSVLLTSGGGDEGVMGFFSVKLFRYLVL